MDASGGGPGTTVRVVMEPAGQSGATPRQWSERLCLPRRHGDRVGEPRCPLTLPLR